MSEVGGLSGLLYLECEVGGLSGLLYLECEV